MDKDRELAGQVDALLSRHGRAGESIDDRNVPMLTELVDAPEWTPVPAPPSAPMAATTLSLLKQLSEQEIDALSKDRKSVV